MQAYKLLNAPIIAYLVTYGANKLVSGNLKILKKFVCSGRERGLENSKKFRCGGRDRPWNILAELLLTEKKKHISLHRWNAKSDGSLLKSKNSAEVADLRA